ncbi:MAG: type II TA system antitoxin MqsA family protein [Acidobacteriota bacterium]
MNCFVCDDGTLTTRLADVEGEIKGEKYRVHVSALVCDKCGHVAMEGSDASEFMRRLADAYRRAHNLLTSEEIRRIRGGMSQQRFAKALGVGVASVKRWELGLVQEERNNALILEFARGANRGWIFESESACSTEPRPLMEGAGLWSCCHSPPPMTRVTGLCH